MIFRRTLNRYTTLPNDILEDRRLSFKALGMIAYIASKPDHWIPRRAELEESHTDGQFSVRAGLTELRKAGYLASRKVRKPSGEWATYVVVDLDGNAQEVIHSLSDSELTDGGKPTPGLTSTNAANRRETAGRTEGAFPTTRKPTSLVSTDKQIGGDRKSNGEMMAAASRAIMDRNSVDCDACGGTGWVEGDDGVQPCGCDARAMP